MPKLIDANVILRCLLRDHPAMTAEANRVIASGAFTTAEVLAEAVYVLHSIYQVDRPNIAASIIELLRQVETDHPDVYCMALNIFAQRKLDFVDCILIARHKILNDDVFSFDKKLNNSL